MRDGDTVGRMGGDEFTVLLPDIKEESDARRVAEKIRDEFVEPFAIGDRRLFVTASVGVALYPKDGLDALTLLKNADAAMYRAKERGRDQYQLYTPDLNAAANERLDLESALHTAIDAGPARAALPAQGRAASRAGSSASRRSCAGTTRASTCRPTSSSPWPRRAGSSPRSDAGCMETAVRPGAAWVEAGLPDHRSP